MEMRRYLESTHLQMHDLDVYHEGGCHRWAADALDKWAGPVEGCLVFADLKSDRLARKEGDRSKTVPWYKPMPPLDPLPKRWEDLHSLRDKLTTLSKHLVTTEEALLPQLTEIEDIVSTGRMWAPKMVNVYDPVKDRSPNGFIKIRGENGYSADLFVRANADFQNDVHLSNSIGSFTQVQWLPYRLPDGQYQIAPELHSVKLPKAAWHTVARVAALLQPHRGRQANIKSILDRSGWRNDGPWLEKEMEVLFQRLPGMDPAESLDGQMDSGSRSREPASLARSIRFEPEENGASVKAREWQEQQRIHFDVSIDKTGEIFIRTEHTSGEGLSK